MWQYYLRWIRTAFERPLGTFDIIAALVSVGGGAVVHFWPSAEHVVGELAWQLPAIALGVLVLFGLARAPYVMHRSDQAAAAAALAKRDAKIRAMQEIRLLHQPSVTFVEAAADREISARWHNLSRDEILHRLLKALWRGDFGDGGGGEGDGRLTFDRQSYGRFGAVRKAALQWGGEHGIPGWTVLLDEDDPVSWEAVRSGVKFEELAAIPPGDYEETLRTAYFEPLRMTGDAFRTWYEKLLRGEYEG